MSFDHFFRFVYLPLCLAFCLPFLAYQIVRMFEEMLSDAEEWEEDEGWRS